MYGYTELTRLNFVSNPGVSPYALLNFGDVTYHRRRAGQAVVTPSDTPSSKMFYLVVVCLKNLRHVYP